MFIQPGVTNFLKYKTIVSRRRPYFTPFSAKVSISFEKIANGMNHPNLNKKVNDTVWLIYGGEFAFQNRFS